MAAVLKVFGLRVQSCVLRTYFSKPSVIFGTRCDYKSGPCKWNLYGTRNGSQRRNLSTRKVGKAKKRVNDDIERRIMVVLKRKKDEVVPQLNEEDLLKYFSGYGEIENVAWSRTKKTDPESGRGYGFVLFTSTASLKEAVASRNHTLSGREVFVYPATARRESEGPAPMQEAPNQSKSVSRASAQTVSELSPTVRSVSAQSVSAWIASAGGSSAQAELVKEVAASASLQTTAAKESSAASTPASSAQAASLQAATAQPASVQRDPARTASTRTLFPRIKTPEDEKRKILVTRRGGCGGKMTSKNVQDYFSAFGTIELFHETKDLMYITFENADSVERVMLVPHHVINDVMVQISLAYTDKQRKQLRLEKAIDEVKVKQNPANMKIAEKEGRKIIFMTPARFRDSINEKSLEDYFSLYGEIEEIFLMESKGYGFITFKDALVAEKVLADGDHKVEDLEVYVKISLASHNDHPGIEEEERKILVSNISGETSEMDIWNHFSKFGKVAEVVFANERDSGSVTDSCIVAFESIHSKMESVIDAFHQIPTRRDALEVKVGKNRFSAQPSASKLRVRDIPEDMTLEMLRDYFEEFGHIQYLGFTKRHSVDQLSTLRGISLAFYQESALEKALNKSVHEINGSQLKVKRAKRSVASRPSDFLSLGLLITNLPENLDKLVVKDYLFRHSCRVKSVKFLAPTVCIASLWNLRDVDRLVKAERHVIGGNPVLLRRLHWVKEQDEGLKVDETIVSEIKS